MILWKKITLNLLGFSLLPFCFACSKNTDSIPFANAGEASGTLPKSWYEMPENGTTGVSEAANNEDIVMPAPKADAAVQAAFAANLEALPDSSQLMSSSLMAEQWDKPADWVPWHLDGFIATFALSHSGLFGNLLFAGTESIKGTWEQSAAKSSALAGTKTPALRVTAKTTTAEMLKQLEPTIRIAESSGAVKNKENFRANLTKQAERFVAISRALDSTPFHSRWHVGGYRLNLYANAAGNVTPTMGVGGGFSLFFSWDKIAGAPAGASTPENALSQKLGPLTQMIAAEIPEALRDSRDLQASGFDLETIEMGLGISAGGSIGIVQGEVGALGKVIFKKKTDGDLVALAAFNQGEAIADGYLNLIESSVNEAHIKYAHDAGIPFAVDAFSPAGAGLTSMQEELVYRIPASRIRNGLKRALKMAAYFTAKARAADTKKWKLAEIEAEFTLSLGGDLKIAIVNGRAQFTLGFERAGK